MIEKLETLILGDCTLLSWVDDSFLTFIGNHKKNLVSLDLSGFIDVSDYGIVGLCSNSECGGFAPLETLSLQSCVRVTSEGLRVAASTFKHLSRLNLRGCLQVNEAGLHSVATLTSLVDLDLCSTTIASLSIISKSLINLQKLNVSNCSKLNNLEGVENFTVLSELSVAGCCRLPVTSLSSL